MENVYAACEFGPISLVTVNKYLHQCEGLIERVCDLDISRGVPLRYMFRVVKTAEIVYTSHPDLATSYTAYLHIVKNIITSNDTVERLVCMTKQGKVSRNHKYSSLRYGEVFYSNTADIYQSYKHFLISINEFKISDDVITCSWKPSIRI